MIKLCSCAQSPLHAHGIEVKALYFSQSPGDKYIKVYAKYKEGKSWVPLQIGLPSAPSLQQVSDIDRNIVMGSGSFDDAHFYLRSADGNNMTTAFYTNIQGGAIQVGNVDGFANLNLQSEGGLLTYGGDEVATKAWTEAEGFIREESDPTVPDWVKAITNQQIADWDGSLMRRSTIITDFNTVNTTGLYVVSGNLRSIPNYPSLKGNNNMANSGYLLVYAFNNTVVQQFYPLDGNMYGNQGSGHWYRTGNNQWEYREGVLRIDVADLATAVHADDLLHTGTYYIEPTNAQQLVDYGYPLLGTALPMLVTVRMRYGPNSANWAVSQTAEVLQEHFTNTTRIWMRACYRWTGGKVFDPWHQIAFVENFYTRDQLGTPGGGGEVAWDNVIGRPPLIGLTSLSANAPLTYDNLSGNFSIVAASASTNGFLTSGDWTSFNNKQNALGFSPENAANKSTVTSLGLSDLLYPSQKAVKNYVDNTIANNNTSFIAISQKGAANGVATLGADGKIPNDQIPALAITDTFTVSSQAAMLALNAQTGDVAVRSDQNKTYILKQLPATLLANWIELKTPTITSSDQVPEGSSNLYFTDARSRAAISALTPISYNAATGIFAIPRADNGTNGYISAADWTVFNSKEPAFAKNTAFNKNFGTSAGTVAEGSDSRIINGQTAFGWGNHAGLYVPIGRSIIAGVGMTGGGTLGSDTTIALGAPSSISLSSTNSVTGSTHTHAFAPGGTASQYIRGDGSLVTFPTNTNFANTDLTLTGNRSHTLGTNALYLYANNGSSISSIFQNYQGISIGSFGTGSTGIKLYSSVTNTNYPSVLKTDSLTSQRTYQFPNASGTLALTSDIVADTNIGNTNQTLTSTRIVSTMGFPLVFASSSSLMALSLSPTGITLVSQGAGSTGIYLRSSVTNTTNSALFNTDTLTSNRIYGFPNASGTFALESWVIGQGYTTNTGTVTSVGLSMPTGFTVSTSPITGAGTLAVSTTLNGPLRGNGSGFVVGSLSAATELTGITPVANGGIGVNTITGVMIGNGTSVVTGITGMANQLLRRNAANSAYEFWTPNYLTSFTEVDPVFEAHALRQPLKWGGLLGGGGVTVNLDNLTAAGVYTTNWVGDWDFYVTNKPSGAITGYGVMAIMEVTNSNQSGSLIILQKLTVKESTNSTNQFFTRMRTGTIWGAWIQTNAVSVPNLNQVTAVGNYSASHVEIYSNHGLKLGVGAQEGWAARDIIRTGYDNYDFVRLTSPGFGAASGYFEVDKAGNTISTGTTKATQFIGLNGQTIVDSVGYWGFYTSINLNVAAPAKMGSLVISDSYSTTAATNGLYVKGNVQVAALSGAGLRMVVASSTGVFSTQIIPIDTHLGNTNLIVPNNTTRTLTLGTGSFFSLVGQSSISLGAAGNDPNINLDSPNGSLCLRIGNSYMAALNTVSLTNHRSQSFQDIDGQIEVLPLAVPQISYTAAGGTLEVSITGDSCAKFGTIKIQNLSSYLADDVEIQVLYDIPYPSNSKAVIFPSNRETWTEITNPYNFIFINSDRNGFTISIKQVLIGPEFVFDYVANGF